MKTVTGSIKVFAAIAALCLTQSVWAQKPDINWFAKNSEADTFHIATADELAGLVKIVNNTAGVGQAFDFKKKVIILDNDINLSKYGANYNAKKGWLPIGDRIGDRWFPFSGTFDGNGKKITGLYINNKELKYVGLFGLINGIVKNLGVENVNITSIGEVGGIAGSLFKGGKKDDDDKEDEEIAVITNCYTTGKITKVTKTVPKSTSPEAAMKAAIAAIEAAYDCSGGIVGYNQGSIIKSYSSAVVNGENSVGGIAGTNDGNVEHCYSTGNISGNKLVGGIVGVGGLLSSNGGNVERSYSTGNINGNNFVGGIAGSGTIISNSYSTGTIKGKDYIGGIAGNASSIVTSYSTGTINGNNYVGGIAGKSEVSNSYSTGTVNGDNTIGGVVGIGYVSNSYSTSTIKGKDHVGGIAGESESVSNCAALNPSVKATGKNFGRIVGTMGGESKPSKNIAFNGMANNAGNTLWLNKGAESINGADITNVTINADGTLGIFFTSNADLATEDGKLPGLGTAIDMPKFILADSVAVEEERTKLIRLIDARDGKKYKIVNIGAQVWMAENLNYKTDNSKCYGEGDKKVTDKKVQDNCKKYGQLYDWETAMKICPQGWHLPSNEEWDSLYRFADGTSGTESPYSSKKAGKYLIANENDKFGFAALPGGQYRDDSFNGADSKGYWWSTSVKDEGRAYSQYIENNYYSNDREGAYSDTSDKTNLLSVRCIKD